MNTGTRQSTKRLLVLAVILIAILGCVFMGRYLGLARQDLQYEYLAAKAPDRDNTKGRLQALPRRYRAKPFPDFLGRIKDGLDSTRNHPLERENEPFFSEIRAEAFARYPAAEEIDYWDKKILKTSEEKEAFGIFSNDVDFMRGVFDSLANPEIREFNSSDIYGRMLLVDHLIASIESGDPEIETLGLDLMKKLTKKDKFDEFDEFSATCFQDEINEIWNALKSFGKV